MVTSANLCKVYIITEVRATICGEVNIELKQEVAAKRMPLKALIARILGEHVEEEMR